LTDNDSIPSASPVSIPRVSLYFIIAQVIFIVVGYIIHAALGRILEPALYGIFGIIIYIMTLVNQTVIRGIPFAASKFIAEQGSQVNAIIRTSFYTQVAMAGGLVVLLVLLAPHISMLLSDESLTPYIYIVAVASILWGLYLLTLYYLNGLHRFTSQATVMVSYSLGKLLLVFILVFAGFSVMGAIIGYLMAPIIGLFVAVYLLYSKPWKQDREPHYVFSFRRMLSFATPIIGFSTTFVLLTNLDLLFVKAILGDYSYAGYYTAAATMARIPFVALTAINFVIFPIISRSTSDGDIRRTRRWIEVVFRYLLMILVPGISILAVTSSAFMDLIYSSEYLPAAAPFSVLVVGMAAITIFQMFANIIIAGGKPRKVMVIGVVQTPLLIVLYMVLIPVFGLLGAAFATSITGLFGAIIAGIVVKSEYGLPVRAKSLLRIVGVAVPPVLAAALLPVHGLLLIPWYLLLMGVYAALLYITKELCPEDFRLLRMVLGIKSAQK